MLKTNEFLLNSYEILNNSYEFLLVRSKSIILKSVFARRRFTCSVPTTAMKPRSRSVAPAELTVASLEAKSEADLEVMKTRDMSRLMLELRKEISWKCAPKASVLAKYAPFCFGLRRLGTGRGAPSEENSHGSAGGPSPQAN